MPLPPSDAEHPDAGESGLDQVIARAAVDRAFRARLLVAPKEAIADVFGLQLPASLRIAFIEKDPEVDVMLVLPNLVDDVGEPPRATPDETGP